MSQPKMTKPTRRGDEVNVADEWIKIMFLPGEACIACTERKLRAPVSAMRAVSIQESAEGIVVRWHS